MKIGIAGYTGRVGQLLVKELDSGEWIGIQLSGGLARNAPKEKAGFFTTTDAKEFFDISDVVIDFTLPDSTMTNARIAAQTKTPLVIGTTGLTHEHEKELGALSKNTPIVYAANMSLGVNLVMALVEKAAKALDPQWDIEIFESHHKHKIDAPSGTALALGKSAAKGRGIKLPEKIDTDRNGKRMQGDIGFSVARGGDVVGEHTALFYAEGERIEISHRATNRAIFARGAIKAAIWVKDKSPALYSMHDVLGL